LPLWYILTVIKRWADTHANLLLGQGGKKDVVFGQLLERQPVLSGGFFIGRIFPNCHAQTSVEMAKEESTMYSNNSYGESHLRRICTHVRQQLLTSNVIATKAIQMGIQEDKVIELLDIFMNEWIEHYNKNSKELKNLTGWILFDSVKRRFLMIQVSK